LTGTEGTIVLEQDRIVAADLRDRKIELSALPGPASNPAATSPVVSDISGHQELLKDFLRAIENDGLPYCDGAEGRRSVALVEAIYESARTGNAVSL
jgi:predicted dehydrogenase